MSRVSRREDLFYEMFRDFGRKIATIGETYYRLVSDWDHNRHLVSEMATAESDCDRMAGSIYDELNRSFITPFDREDVGALTNFLDEIVDGMESVSLRFQLFDVDEMIPEALKMAEITRQATAEVADLMDYLPQFHHDPRVMEQVNKIRNCENDADVVYHNGLASLFKEGADPIFVMKWKSLLDKMEDTVDQCKNVCKVVQGVVMKNA